MGAHLESTKNLQANAENITGRVSNKFGPVLVRPTRAFRRSLLATRVDRPRRAPPQAAAEQKIDNHDLALLV